MLGIPSFPARNSPQRLSGDAKNDDKNSSRSSSRTKVALKPGRSLMHWISLGNGGKDIQGFRGRTFPVLMSDLEKHNKVDDCWMAIRGQVYNVTEYMEYHPGGIDELMKGAGKDATNLFNEVHKWVNFASMLAKCYIGPLKYDVVESVTKPPSGKELKKTKDGFLIPTNMISQPPSEVIPRYDWYEKDDTLVLSIYTKTKLIDSTDVLMDCMNCKTLDIKIFLGINYYQLLLDLEKEISSVVVSAVNKTKVDFLLTKKNPGIKWNTLGLPLSGHNELHIDRDRDLTFRDCRIESVKRETHDTRLYAIALPTNVYYETPIGHHVVVKGIVEGMEIRRSYTVVLPSLDVKQNAESGKIHLLIKSYPNGALTPTLSKLEKGDLVSTSDCLGTFLKKRLKEAHHIYLIAAGTVREFLSDRGFSFVFGRNGAPHIPYIDISPRGFTPMIRLINYYLCKEPQDDRYIKLLFANKTERDIIWKDQIDSMVKMFPDRFHVTYILSQPDESWKGLRGLIDEERLRVFLTEEAFTSAPSSNQQSTPSIRQEETFIAGLDQLFAVCGPDEFTIDVKKSAKSNCTTILNATSTGSGYLLITLRET